MILKELVGLASVNLGLLGLFILLRYVMWMMGNENENEIK